MTILVTWTSGFIGFHTAKRLLDTGETIVGIDNENDYYDISLKVARRSILEEYENFHFYKCSLEDNQSVRSVFEKHKIHKIIHLAAQAWVRYSITNPSVYIASNLLWFYTIIELAREFSVENFVYASSSSVYGKNKKQLFSVEDKTDAPISLYAATKKSNELIAHSYSHLFWLPTTGIRFFTVYWPWGRPDMAMMLFADWITNGKPINVFNHGDMKRDFTYIDDIVDWILLSLDKNFPYEILNLGNDSPVQLEYLINLIEKNLGKPVVKNYMDMQPWDIPATWADIDHTREVLEWSPKISIEEWVRNFSQWYKSYFNL